MGGWGRGGTLSRQRGEDVSLVEVSPGQTLKMADSACGP